MSPMKIDHEAIRNLATLLTETDLTEIEISEGDQKIRVTRSTKTQVITTPAAMPEMSAANMSSPIKENAKTSENHPGAIKSPMVGTAYLQPEPDKPSFVQKGDAVQAGDTLLILEAMKVMNPIKAAKAGTVKSILVEDGQAVEFGQVLIIIE